MESFLESGNYTLYLTTALSQNTPLGDVVEVLARDGWSHIRQEEEKGIEGWFKFELFGFDCLIIYYEWRGCYYMDFKVTTNEMSFWDVDKREIYTKPSNHKHLQEVLYRKIIKHIQTGQPIINQS